MNICLIRNSRDPLYGAYLSLFCDYEREIRLGSAADPNGTSAEKLLRRVNGGDASVLHALICSEDGAAGFVHACVDREGIFGRGEKGAGWILSFCIAQEKRRQGLGRELSRYAEQWLKDAGAKGVFLTPDSGAIRFWNTMGYASTGETDPEDGSEIWRKM